MSELYTTFDLLRQASACTERYAHLGRALGGIKRYGRTTPISLLRILATNGLDDALWALRAVPPEQVAVRDRLARLYACWCVRQIWGLLTDKRSRAAVEVAERYAIGEATCNELAAASASAWDASASAWAARAAASASAWDARAAASASAWDARAAARAAVWDARAAARASAWDASASAWAARAAARAAVWDAWAAQTQRFGEMLEEVRDE